MVDKKEALLLGLVALMFLVSFYLYPLVPDQVPVHWNAAGEADRYGSKAEGLFLMPVVLAVIYLIFWAIPKVAVLKGNVDHFYKRHGFGFRLMFMLFFWGVYLASAAPNFGYEFNMTQFMVPAIAVLFFYIGHMLKDTKRNFFIGIKTPWTLSDDVVWKKTHELGAKLFKAFAVLVLLTLFFPGHFLVLFIVPILGLIAFLFAYSYHEFRKRGKHHGRGKGSR